MAPRASRSRPAHSLRVALRPLRDTDGEVLGDWLAIDGGDERLVITRVGDEVPIGLLRYVADAAGGWVRFESVAVRPELRGLGLESEAVRLLEEGSSRRGDPPRFYATVNPEDGLGVYFWLRLGYRPVRTGEIPWHGVAGEGMMVMVKEGTGE